MAETIQRGIFQEGMEIGVAKGIARGKAEGVAEGVAKGKVLAILEVRFNKISKRVEKAIQSMTDLIALQSLVEHAKTCKSLDDFAEALR